MANEAQVAETPAENPTGEPEGEKAIPIAESLPTGLAATILKDRFHIFPGTPLPHLNSPTAKAFLAHDSRDSTHNVFALLCPVDVPPRAAALGFFKSETFPGLLQLIDYGPVFWPMLGRTCMVVIYQQPMGGRVMEQMVNRPPRERAQDIGRLFLEPMIHLLRDMIQRGIPLRSIRADNIFFVDEARTQIAVGDCVTVPAGYDQPVLYEPIERAMANRSGRGQGDFKCDLYAFGATLAVLIMGDDPTEGMTDIEIVTAKIEVGSYATLARSANIPISVLEPLRGLLMDDMESRWGIEELEFWLDGRRLTPMQKSSEKRAEIGFRFNDGSYNNLRTLAWAFSRAPRKAYREIQGDELVVWVRRALGLKELSLLIASIARASDLPTDKALREDLIVSRICILFDNDAPIRYKGFSFLSDGFGPAMAIEYLRNGDAQIPAEILRHDLVGFWFGLFGPLAQATQGERKSFTQLRSMLAISEPGYGLERCLYDVNPALHCLSPVVENGFVLNSGELLMALEDAAKHADETTKPVDRHIAAFIASRFGPDTGKHLVAFASSDNSISTLGMLSLLALLQWRLGVPSLPNLAKWMGALVKPALQIYRGKTTRTELEGQLPRVIKKGSLPELFSLLNNAERREEDTFRFLHAQHAFAVAEDEILQIEANASKPNELVENGEMVATIFSIFIALIVSVFLYMSERW